MTNTAEAPILLPPTVADSHTNEPHLVALTRGRIDQVLIGMGLVAVIVLTAAASLLTWGSSFTSDYVSDELSSQNITFGTRASLEKEGREDLLSYAGEKLDTGQEAQAYASFIDGHLTAIGKGKTFADLGIPERAAKLELQEAKDTNQPQATIDALQANAAQITQTRDTLFKGETLRGLLLTAYAWSTVGRIAGIAGIGAIIAAGLMAILVILGISHLVGHPRRRR